MKRRVRSSLSLPVGLLFLTSLSFPACTQPPSPEDVSASHEDNSPGRSGSFAPSGIRSVDVPRSGVELGLGWLTGRSQIVNSRCIEFAPIQETGQTSTLSIHEVSDQSEIMDRLGVSATVSVKAMFGSGSAKASFARDSKTRSNSTNLVLEARIENGVMFVGPPDPPSHVRKAYPDPGASAWERDDPALGSEEGGDVVRLKPWALQLLTDHGIAEFRRHCGDSFVSAIHSGAEVLATVQFTAKDSATRKKITAAIKGKYGPAKMSTATNRDSEKAVNETDLTIHYLQIGGGNRTLPISQEGLAEKLEDLPKEAFENPKFHAMEVTSYTALPDWPPDQPLGADIEEVNEVVADYYWLLTTLENDIEEIIDHPADYDFRTGKPVAGLAGLYDEILDLRRSLLVAMAIAAGGPVPDTELNPTVYAFLPDYSLDFEALKKSLERLGDTEPNDTDQWFAELAGALKKSVPFENPNVLRILLPRPCSALEPDSDSKDSVQLRKAAVDWYVRPQVMRMCELDPLDNECLTLDELTRLETKVPDGESSIECPPPETPAPG